MLLVLLYDVATYLNLVCVIGKDCPCSYLVCPHLIAVSQLLLSLLSSENRWNCPESPLTTVNNVRSYLSMESTGWDLKQEVRKGPEEGTPRTKVEEEIGVLTLSPVMKSIRATAAVKEPHCPHHQRMIYWQ